MATTATRKRGIEKRLEELGLSYTLKYLRDKKGVPRVAIAMVKKDGKPVGIGVAVCSPKDNPVKRVFRNKAIGRAISAYLTETKIVAEISGFRKGELQLRNQWGFRKFMSRGFGVKFPKVVLKTPFIDEEAVEIFHEL